MESELACTSEGGPATNVTWARMSADSEKTVLKKSSQVTVLDDKVIAEYTHTLSMGDMIIPGDYECFVSNNKPSSAKAVATLNENGMFLKYVQRV